MSRPVVSAHRRRNGSPKPKVTRLLYSRESTREVLGGLSDSSLRRFEILGVLHPIKLNPTSKTAKTFYSVDEVHKIASGETQSVETE